MRVALWPGPGKTPKFAIPGIPEIVLPPRDSAWRRRHRVSMSAQANISTEIPIDASGCSGHCPSSHNLHPSCLRRAQSPEPALLLWVSTGFLTTALFEAACRRASFAPHPLWVMKGSPGPRLSALGSPAPPSSDGKPRPRLGKQRAPTPCSGFALPSASPSSPQTWAPAPPPPPGPWGQGASQGSPGRS